MDSPANFCLAAPQFERRGDALLVRAPAKINLDLLVAPRRADGYHDLDSLVAKVSLYDEIIIRPCPGKAIKLTCDGADCGEIEKNLVYRAAIMLADRMAQTCAKAATGTRGLSIELIKHTPPGKGLGGGSSDAAATLLGLNELLRPGWQSQLPALSAALGSDVPLFLGGPASRMTGRGEIVQPIEVHPFTAVLVLPDLFCATPAVYKAFDALQDKNVPRGEGVPPSRPAGVSPASCSGMGVPPMRPEGVSPAVWNRSSPAGLERGETPPGASDARRLRNGKPMRAFDTAQLLKPPSAWRHLLVNDLLPPAMVVCPALADLKARLQACTQIPIHMTGSGSALFALCDDNAEATTLLDSFDEEARRLCVCVESNPW